MPSGCGQNFCKDARMSRIDDRAHLVMDVHEWDLYDDMPVRWCNPTTTMEDFANGRAPQGQY